MGQVRLNNGAAGRAGLACRRVFFTRSIVSLSDSGVPSWSPSLVMYIETLWPAFTGPGFSGQNRLRCRHLTSHFLMRSCVCRSSADTGASSLSKKWRRLSTPMIGTSRCLAMHAVMSNAPMCRPRVRKLCTHATASCPGIALVNMDCRVRSVASS